MPYRSPPSEEELARLSKRIGCKDCEFKGRHGGREVCRRQVAGKYNRQVFYDRSSPDSRPTWCPDNLKGPHAGKRGYASAEALPETTGVSKPAEAVMPPSTKMPAMPLSPIRGVNRQELSRAVKEALTKGVADDHLSEDPQYYQEPKETAPKLKRKAKDAPWGVTSDKKEDK